MKTKIYLENELEGMSLRQLEEVYKAQGAVIKSLRDNDISKANEEAKKRGIIKTNEEKINSLKKLIDEKLLELTTGKRPMEKVNVAPAPESDFVPPPPLTSLLGF